MISSNWKSGLERPNGELFSPPSHTEVWNSTNICPLWLSTCKISLYVYHESTQPFACVFAVPHKLLMSPRLHTGSVFSGSLSLSIVTITPATQITQQSLCHTPFSLIYPQAIFIQFDHFSILQSLGSLSLNNKKKKKDREERQREQTKTESVTKIPAVEEK